MNSRVRQVLPWATGGCGPMASPARPACRFPVPMVAGNAVRHATAKAPDGAGAIGAAGHVVAPALPADGPGFFLTGPISAGSALPSHGEWMANGPRSVTRDCYAAHQDGSRPIRYNRRTRIRDSLPAPDQGTRMLDRTRGDRLRRSALRRAVEARSGFGRAVSLSFEPAPQISCFMPYTHAPRIRRGIVARALP